MYHLAERERELKPNYKDISRRAFLTLAGTSAFALSSIGSYNTLAYFSDTDTKKNDISVAQNLDVEILEPNWDPESAKNVAPTQTISKDPLIKNNTKEYTGYLYMEVRVPFPYIKVYDKDKKKTLTAKKTALYNYTVNPNWELLETFEDGAYLVRRYAYTIPVEGGGETPSIFDSVTVANLVNNANISNTDITVIAYGIQSEGFVGYQDAWIAYKNQNSLGAGHGLDYGEAYAVYCEDNTLYFIRAEEAPAVGEIYNNSTILYVYSDIETMNTSSEGLGCYPDEGYIYTAPPWRDDIVDGKYIRHEWVPGENDVREVRIVDKIKPICLAEWFSDLAGVTNYYGLENIDTSMVADTSWMFSTNVNVQYLYGLESWDMSKVINMEGMFGDMWRLRRLEIPNWDCSNCERMFYAFAKLFSVKEIIVPYWKTPNIKDMSYLFDCNYGCEYIDMRGWDTSKVKNLSSVFDSNCYLEKIDGLNEFVTDSCTDMSWLFNDTPVLEHLDLSNFNTSNVEDFSHMFYGYEKRYTDDPDTDWNREEFQPILKTLNICNWSFDSAKNVEDMFKNRPTLTTIFTDSDLDLSTNETFKDQIMFNSNLNSLVGQNGTKYNSKNNTSAYACVDGLDGKPGYFTAADAN